jgi:glutamyl-Q tRNA(Asp) synthetase
MNYVGRFAPSPSGLLHAGSVVAALASYLDAKQHQGRWLIRMEDVDTTRCRQDWGMGIIQQLQALSLQSDGDIVWQSQRDTLYQQALTQLIDRGWVYPCGCSRKDIESAQALIGVDRVRHQETIYPGTCREGLRGKSARAWRLNVQRVIDDLQLPSPVVWHDRRLGLQSQDVAADVGDFVLRRADGVWAYQLAVVVDDAAQHITHVVRGEDLADNTARQILLQRALDLPALHYLHTPLVLTVDGEKLSKQNGAAAIQTSHPLDCLNEAAVCLGLPRTSGALAEALQTWQELWSQLWQTSKP